MKKLLFALFFSLLLTSCSFFSPKDNSPVETIDVSTGTTSDTNTTNTGTLESSTGSQTTPLSYDELTKDGCSLDVFEFANKELTEKLVGISYNNLLMLRSKTGGFECIKLQAPIVGGTAGFLIDDYGEDIALVNLVVHEDHIEVPDQKEALEFIKLRYFIALENKIGGVFQGFFYPAQLKNIKIDSLGIAVFEKGTGLIGYEVYEDETYKATKNSLVLAKCIENDPVLRPIYDDKGTVLEGIFRQISSEIDVSKTVMSHPRFYHSYITYFYANDLKNHPEKFDNTCFTILK